MAAPRDVKLFSLRLLRRNKRNPRTHSRKQIRQIANSIARFGWTYPILVDESNLILAGHGRYEAALQLGQHEVPVIIVSDLSDAKKRALALADNKVAANAGWDRKLLAEELGELAELLPECNLDLQITGFEAAEIDGLLGDLVDPERDPADEISSPKKQAVSKRSDLWELGSHKLLCGDAESAPDFRRLMAGEFAKMVIADPPYNLPIKQVQGRGSIKHQNFTQGCGEMSPARFTRFLRASLSIATKYSVRGAIHFVFMDWRHIGDLLAAGSAVYSELKNIIVWVKTNAGQGTFYRSQHELICVYKSGDASHINNFELGQHGRNRSNVWTYAGVNTFRAGRMDDLAIHPTVKPVALIADAMRDCSRRGDIVLDPFIGSGTTIMAAERVGRRGYGLELDPLYADAAVRRWQAYTKRDAILKGTGQTFDEVSVLRKQEFAMNKRGRSLHGVRRSSSGGRYNVGYGRPPKQNQYQPGQSGNPKGRPKGRKNTATLLREILDRMIEVRNGSTMRKISVREAMLTRFAESALKGDTKSAAFLLQRYDLADAGQEPANGALAPEEQEIIDSYLGAYLQRKGADK